MRTLKNQLINTITVENSGFDLELLFYKVELAKSNFPLIGIASDDSFSKSEDFYLHGYGLQSHSVQNGVTNGVGSVIGTLVIGKVLISDLEDKGNVTKLIVDRTYSFNDAKNPYIRYDHEKARGLSGDSGAGLARKSIKGNSILMGVHSSGSDQVVKAWFQYDRKDFYLYSVPERWNDVGLLNNFFLNIFRAYLNPIELNDLGNAVRYSAVRGENYNVDLTSDTSIKFLQDNLCPLPDSEIHQPNLCGKNKMKSPRVVSTTDNKSNNDSDLGCEITGSFTSVKANFSPSIFIEIGSHIKNIDLVPDKRCGGGQRYSFDYVDPYNKPKGTHYSCAGNLASNYCLKKPYCLSCR